MKREAKKIYPTMKLKTKAETDIPFQECQCEIVEIKDVETEKFGKKQVATLKNDGLGVFGVFINN